MSGPTREEPSRARVFASLALTSVLAACAGLAFAPVFGTHPLLLPVAVASVVPAAVCAFATARARLPAWSAAATSALVAVLSACPTVFRTALPAPDAVRAMGLSLVDTPHLVLGTIPPVPPQPRPLFFVFATVWGAAYCGAELALRGRGRALPALPAAALLCGAALLSAGSPPALGPAAALLAAGGLLVTVRQASGSPPSGVSRIRAAAALPVVAVLTAAASAATPLLPGVGRHTVDLRALATNGAPATVQGVSPLDRVSSWLRDPARPMFSIAATGAAPDELWRLTEFDRYDGVSWLPVSRLAATGGGVPPAADSSGTAHRVVQHVTVQRLPGPWLPAADRPTDVDVRAPGGTAVAVDPDDGVLATDTTLTSGTRYTVESLVRTPSAERVPWAPAADDPADTALPLDDATGHPLAVVDDLRSIAQHATAGAEFPYQQALRLAQWLRSTCVFDADATPGHAYRNLQFFLETSRQGTPEQFAASFAVLARTLGLPTRVAVGFRGGTASGSVVQVTAGDVVAWDEVQFTGVGWVPFFPTPDPGPASAVPPPPGGRSAPQPVQVAPAQRDAGLLEAQHAPPAPAPAVRARRGGGGLPWWAWWATAGGAVAGASGAGWHWGRPLVRRRRRRTRGVAGAWHQVTEVLEGVGMPATGALTAAEVAGFARVRLGLRAGEAVTVLGGLYNEAAYARPERPASERAVELAWRCCGEAEQAARGRWGRRASGGEAVGDRGAV